MTDARSRQGEHAATCALTIRPATPAHLDSLVELQCALTEETEHIAADPVSTRTGVDHVLRSPEHGRYIVAADAADTIVGCLMLLPEWITWHAAEVWWIHDVYVRPGWRRHGVFRLLYDHVREQVRANPGVLGLRLYVARGNAKAQRTYRELGMSDDSYILYEWMSD